VKRLITVCGQRAVEHAYWRDLSSVHTEDQLADLFCEIAFCAGVSALSSTPPRLRPPSSRPGRDSHCDVQCQIAGISVYAEVKRYIDPWLRKEWSPTCRDELRPIDLYRKLCEVPEQFPEGQLNLLFVFHATLNQHEALEQEVLEQALLGWREDHLRPGSAEPEHQRDAGLFAREEWRDISGCCLCRIRDGELQCLNIWDNPRAAVFIPPLVHSALSRGTE